jgi:hypothetical protein
LVFGLPCPNHNYPSSVILHAPVRVVFDLPGLVRTSVCKANVGYGTPEGERQSAFLPMADIVVCC